MATARWLLALLLFCSWPAAARVDKVTSATPLPLATPSRPLPAEALLDVGILPFADGLDRVDEDEPVYPEVRRAETVYFAAQLAKVLEQSGAWGMVRVIPSAEAVVDLYLSGEVLQSDGETLALAVEVRDVSGRRWYRRDYRQRVGKYAYDRRVQSLGDPFRNLYVEIANDLLAARESLPDARAVRLRQIAEVRYAERLAPEAFAGYLEKRRGELVPVRLPAENDPLLERVRRVRERDQLFLDTLQAHYDHFAEAMHGPYQEYRRQSYDAVVEARRLGQLGRARLIAGIGAIVAGIYGRVEGDSPLSRDLGTVSAISGGLLVKSGLEKQHEAAVRREAVAELGASLEEALAPTVLELEERTVTLTGTLEERYRQWQALLAEIYREERGEL
ncbi:MAG: hypothetical protein KatS3mg124_0579 [Porticoccaceae bacterium]|nr:MAG: hypothetical protein KatS3mg124_0579 [Porticoccaceae bacterium]